MRKPPDLSLDMVARAKLEEMSRKQTLSARVRSRVMVVLLAAEGLSDTAIAKRLKVAPKMAARWRQRFLERGYEGLLRAAPGRGRFPKIDDALRAKVIRTASQRSRNGKPASSLELAPILGISAAAIRKILREERQS
jgi:transposase